MTTTPVSSGGPYEVTSGNTLEVTSGGSVTSVTVDSGGTLQVDAGGTETSATVEFGGVETVLGSGSGDQIYGSVTIGTTGVENNATVQNGGTLLFNSKGGAGNNITVSSGGLLLISGNVPANNVTLAGGTIELQSPKADTANTSGPTASGGLTFAQGTSGTLRIDVAQTGSNGTTFAQTLSGFAAGDIVDLKYLTSSGATLSATQNGSSVNLTVTGGGSTGSETFTFANTTAANFAIVGDGNGGSAVAYNAVCFCSGVCILTARGEVAVEDLRVGDLAVTASGQHRPVRWIGRQSVDCRAHPRPAEVMPVRIAAGALGPDRPSRDLWVSPGHALCLDLLGEALVPASALLNGATVAQVDVASVTYWHVELDGHDVLLADGQPAESYMDCGNRLFFGTGEGTVDPDRAAATPADYCRPFHHAGPLVAAARHQLRARAGALGWTLHADPLADLHLVVDGARIEAEVDGASARFAVPAEAAQVWLASRAAVPRDVGTDPNGDPRRLGLCVTWLGIDDGLSVRRRIAHDDPRLMEGWNGAEADHRWTDGRARLDPTLWAGCRSLFFLRVELAAAVLPGWRAPEGLVLSDVPATSEGQRGLRLVQAA